MNGYQMKSRRFHYTSWSAIIIILLVIAFLRSLLLTMPLERDEGEFAYIGQLLLQGIPPYLEAYSMKLPGTAALYALFMGIFGQSILAIHLGLLIFNAFAICFVFLVTRHLHDNIAGIFAALVFALFSLSPSVFGNAAHATQFLVLFVLSGLFLLLQAIDQKKIWLLIASGLLLGSAVLVKQHAVFFVFFAVIYYCLTITGKSTAAKTIFYNTSALIIASVFPFLAVCWLLYHAGVFSTFWFWTFHYAMQRVSETPLALIPRNFLAVWMSYIHPWRFIWVIAAIGLSSVFWNKKARQQWIFWMAFTVFSFLSICPGYFFHPHYFVTLLPAIAMLSGIAVSTTRTYLSNRFSSYFKMIPIAVIIMALIVPAWEQKKYFGASPIEAGRMIYGAANPFPESLVIAEYIKNQSTAKDTIAILGSEPQIYFYANRKSASGHICVYAMMERQPYASQMQREMIRDIAKAQPKYIVFINFKFSWLNRPDSDTYLLHWVEKYLNDYYLLRGTIKSMSDLKINTDTDPQDIRQLWNPTMAIFERRP